MTLESHRYTYDAVVIRVIDGDTVEVDIDQGLDNWTRQKLRLFGINAPETRGADRQEGIVAKIALRDKVRGRQVIIKTNRDRTGKYGRYLATIYLDGEYVNQWMVHCCFAQKIERDA